MWESWKLSLLAGWGETGVSRVSVESGEPGVGWSMSIITESLLLISEKSGLSSGKTFSGWKYPHDSHVSAKL